MFFGTHILIPGNRELQSPTFKYKKIWSRNMAKTWLDIEGVWPLSTRGECKNMIKDLMQRWSWNSKSKEPMLRNSRGGNDPWLGALTICIKYDLSSQISHIFTLKSAMTTMHNTISQNVNITNFTNCWADGLAFCALIHHFFPQVDNFYKLMA